MLFGVASQAFEEKRYRELAPRIREFGFDAIYLELKHLSDIDYRLGMISKEFANHFAEVYERAGVAIPVLGCYSNLIHPDPDIRRENIAMFKEHLRYAKHFGANVVATETGTASDRNPWDPHPDNQNEEQWRLLREVLSELAEEAEKHGVSIALEGYYNNVIGTPERMERMLREVSSPRLGIVADPCNYINRAVAARQDDVIREMFDRLENVMLLAHAKDIYISDTKESTPAAGTGMLNHRLYYELLLARRPDLKIYFEHLNETQMPSSVSFVRDVIHQIQGEAERS